MRAAFRCALTAVLLALLAQAASADAVRRPKSYIERRYETTVRQIFDFTCGAASLATVLRYYWGEPASEKQVLDVIRGRYDPVAWRAKQADGMSFDDLIYAARKLGFEAAGAAIDVGQLAKIEAPVVVHLDKGSFQHFSVLRRVVDDVYYLSDPILGALGMPGWEFREQFTGKALAIARRNGELARATPLSTVRDGLSVRDSLRGVVDRSPQNAAAGLN